MTDAPRNDGTLDDRIFEAVVDVYHPGIDRCGLRHHWLCDPDSRVQFNVIEVVARDGRNDAFNAFAIDLENGAIYAVKGGRPKFNVDNKCGVEFADSLEIGEPFSLNANEPGDLLAAVLKALCDEFETNDMMQMRANRVWTFVSSINDSDAVEHRKAEAVH